MKIRLAQYGISHDHASGKARVMKESDEIEFAGVFEPSPEVRETLGQGPIFMKAFTGLRPKKRYSKTRQSLGLRRRDGYHRISPLHGRFSNTASMCGSINLRVIISMNFGRCWTSRETGSCSFNSVICSDIMLVFSLSLIGCTPANSAKFFRFEGVSHQDPQAMLIGNVGIHSVSTPVVLCSSSPVISPTLSLHCWDDPHG